MNPRVDWFFEKESKWQQAYKELRILVLDCGLTEELKWGCPCYTYDQSNIVVIHGFKDYCALMFMKGALMKDEKGILIQPTKNVQAARQVRFTDVKQIVKMKTTLKTYIKEAITIEKKGLKVEFKKASEFEVTPEFQHALKKMPDLKKAFYKLTPGRQRGYLLYFSSAKQSKTRQARVEKYADKILEGKGLND